jgi:citrate lyase subunit beta/citryl-CoA lyase
VLAAQQIAAARNVVGLSVGAVDLARDLRLAGSWNSLQTARSMVVLAAAAAGIDPPVDSAYQGLADLAGLERETVNARDLGFFGKVAIHPSQLEIINRVFSPEPAEIAWAQRVLAAFDRSGGQATRTEHGDFVDLPVADRAKQVLAMAGLR